MRVICVLTIVGLVLISNVLSHGNPCPQHWHYVKDDSGEIQGRVTFKNPTHADEYHVKVYLSVKGNLKSENPGSVELGNTDITEVLNGGILWFKVRFPQQKPIPVLVGLKLNDQVLCQGESAHGSVTTSIKLETEVEV